MKRSDIIYFAIMILMLCLVAQTYSSTCDNRIFSEKLDSLYVHKDYFNMLESYSNEMNLTSREEMILQSVYYKLLNVKFNIETFKNSFVGIDNYDTISTLCLCDLFSALQNAHEDRTVIEIWDNIKDSFHLTGIYRRSLYARISMSYYNENDYGNYAYYRQEIVESNFLEGNSKATRFWATVLYNTLRNLNLEEKSIRWKEICRERYLPKDENPTITIDDWFDGDNDWILNLFKPKDAVDSLLHIISSTATSVSKKQILLDSLLRMKIPQDKYHNVSQVLFKNQLYNHAIDMYMKELDAVEKGERYKGFDDAFEIYHNIAVSYLWLNNPYSAMWYLRYAEKRLKILSGISIGEFELFASKRAYYYDYDLVFQSRYLSLKRHIMLKERAYDLMQEFDSALVMGKLYEKVSMYDSISSARCALIEYNSFHLETSAHINICQMYYDSATLCLRNAFDLYKKLYGEILLGDTSDFFYVKQTYSSKEREVFMESYDVMRCMLYTYMRDIDYEPFTRLAYDYALFTKGLLLNTDRTIAGISGDSAINIMRIINDNKEKLKLSNSVWYRDSIQNLIDENERLLMKLANDEDLIKNDNISLQPVMNAITSNQIVVEFVCSNRMNAYIQTDTIDYYALILDKSKRLHKVYLFSEDELPEYKSPDIMINDTCLMSMVWKNVLTYVQPSDTIYFSPVGILCQLPIEYIRYDSISILSDVYSMIRLSSTREVVTHNDNSCYNNACLYGGVKYDVTNDELIAESKQYNCYNILTSRGIENDTLNRGMVNFLKGTEVEIENINEILKDNNLHVKMYSSIQANEESFKALNGKNTNIIHIATHGFFWPDKIANNKDYFLQQRSRLRDDNDDSAINPLDRCGLLFAGANTALQGHSDKLPSGVQDGVLTATEISLVDLRGTDLVVLSACETGKGEVTWDGVFGLQRAFKLAGVQTIVMSLWPVDDHATQLFMTEFYRNWIKGRQSKREAFKNAQNAVRAKYEEPVYWAAFVMMD